CTECMAGEFASGPRNAVCAPCPVGTRSPQRSISCTACTAGKFNGVPKAAACSLCPAETSSPPGSISRDDCGCFAGYTPTPNGTGESCITCTAGAYKADTGPGPCIECAASTYSVSTGASECVGCQARAESAVGATHCYCSIGSEQEPEGGCLHSVSRL
ncbi:hypothetical protein T484DRAFT_1645817, partial [Baffinella frigidus]